MSIVVRAVVAVGLLVGFYVAGFAVLAGLVWTTVLLAHIPALHDVAFVTAATAVGLVLPLWQIGRAAPQPPPGVTVTEDQAPELWALVRAVAVRVDTRAPDEIRLIGDFNAGVWENAGRIGLRRGRRYLYVGVPLIAIVDENRLRAVMAHEMGHYAGGHTVFGSVAYRGSTSITQTIRLVGPARIGGLVLTSFAAVYFLVALKVMRSMEFEADRDAARIVGVDAMRQTLSDTPVLAATWTDTLRRYVASAAERGYRPATLIDAFRLMERSPAPPPTRTRWDSHPTTAERIAALSAVTSAVDVDPRPAVDLIDDPDLLPSALDTDEFAQRIEAAAQRRAEDATQVLYAAADRIAGRAAHWGLAGVFDLLDGGRAHALAAALPHEDLLVDHVVAAMSTKLISEAGARWVHVWGQPLTLRSSDNEVIALRPLVSDACAHGTAVTTLRRELDDLGLSVETAIGRSAFDPGPVFYTLAGAAPHDLTLLLPDRLYLLAHGLTGHQRIASDIIESTLAAATLAELRRTARIELVDGDMATVRVADRAPTGDGFLDSVLTRLAGSRPRPAYQWLQAIGPEIALTVQRRLEFAGYMEGGGLTQRGRAAMIAIREDLITGLRSSVDPDAGDPLVLLLWAAEMTKAVLGWAVVLPRFFAGRLAARDPLMVGVRIVTGLNITLPTPIRGT